MFNGNYHSIKCKFKFNYDKLPKFKTLETFRKLKYFDCSFSSIRCIKKLMYNNKLIWLNCSYNKIINLNNLPNSLTKLNCSCNQIINLDNLPNSLIEINYSRNNIKNLHKLYYYSNSIIYLNYFITGITHFF